MSGKRKLLTTPGALCTATHGHCFNLLAPEFEFMDPNPDIHALFIEYNQLFFDGTLSGCEVKWSKRMTLCAGLCSYQPSSGFCSIRLSEPLLKLRPRSDLINTLLHEMIHAYIFVSSPVRDHEDHGPVFQSHMHRINQSAGTVITVFHTFHDEVDSYRQHWWQCDGPCRREKPFFGLVKRAMNRPPGPLDRWWEDHQKACGGKYTKIKEPPGFKEKQEKKLLRQQKKQEKERNSKSVSVKNFFPVVDGDASTNNKADATPKNIATKKPKVDHPKSEKPKVEKPKVEKPKIEKPKVETPKSPFVSIPQPSAATGSTRISGGSAHSISVPESAVVVVGEDGEFFLCGDVTAMFQSTSTASHRKRDSGFVDLTETDDEADPDQAPLAQRIQRPRRDEDDDKTRPSSVEIIEID